MTDRARGKTFRGIGAPLAAFLLLSACYEEKDTTLPASTESAAPTTNAPNWLEPTSNEDPVAFLMRLSGEEASVLAPRLESATSRYREGPRMIANRIVQLWQELKKTEGDLIPVSGLLDEFSQIEPGPEESIGVILQQYRILREQGLGHQAAIATLAGAGDG